MGKAARSLAALFCLLSSVWVTAQKVDSTAARVSPQAHPATPVSAAVSPDIIPLDQIHEGMKGTALTVFQGVKPESMEVEVLGVLHNANGPKGDIILVRLHGAKPEYTGVVAGMSGARFISTVNWRVRWPFASVSFQRNQLQASLRSKRCSRSMRSITVQLQHRNDARSPPGSECNHANREPR